MTKHIVQMDLAIELHDIEAARRIAKPYLEQALAENGGTSPGSQSAEQFLATQDLAAISAAMVATFQAGLSAAGWKPEELSVDGVDFRHLT